MADRDQLRSGLACRSLDDGAAEVSLELVVVVLVDGVVCDMLEELLLVLGAVLLGIVLLGVLVVDGLVAGVDVVLVSAGRAGSLVDCA